MSASSSRAAVRLAVLAWALQSLACATLSIEDERRLGAEAERQIQSELRFVRDPVVVGYVESMGASLLRAAGPQPFEYRFYVVEDQSINAFAMPAGSIYIHTETILKARNASELAGVLGHEIGHVALRHVARNYHKQRTAGLLHQFGVLAAGLTLGSMGANAADLVGGVSALAVVNSFTREAEREADSFAVEVLPRADYDPYGVVTFFDTLRQESQGRPPAFLASHPAPEERILETREQVVEMQLPPGLRQDDSGRLEIIQARIRLLTGDRRGRPASPEL